MALFNYRRPAHAGSFYPLSTDSLVSTIANLLPEHPLELTSLRGLILPHAGYSYSGKTMAKGYGAIPKNCFRRIILLAPAHYVPIRGISVEPYDLCQTPIGDLPIDLPLRDELRRKGISSVEQAHRLEHATEVHFPFLVYTCPQIPILPILCGTMSKKEIKETAQLLESYWDEQTLLIVSSDFTHYGSHFDYLPFPVSQAPKELRKLDYQAIQYLLHLDSDGFSQFCDQTQITICGKIPILLLLEMSKKNYTIRLLEYTTSAELSGDYSHSVSYASLAVLNPPYSLSQQKIMLEIARNAIRTALKKEWLQIPNNLSPELQQLGAVFVTLKVYGELRGCIGTIFPHRPLIEDIITNARQAAFHDSRFPPLTQEELDHVRIRISILSPPKSIKSYQEIVLGYHGIILSYGNSRAVFLPEVPIEQGWDLPTTLSFLSRKAGLSSDAWKQATFEVFTTFCFGED